MLKSSLLSFLGRGPGGTAGNPSVAAGDSRRFERIEASLAAVLHVDNDSVPVTIANLSPAGAMVELPAQLSAGQGVHLVRGGLYVQGTVIWSSQGRSGIEFAHPIYPPEWLAAAPNAGQSRVDEIVALVKAGVPAAQLREKEPGQSGHSARLEDDFQMIVDLLQNLKEDLSRAQDTVDRHGAKFDLLDRALKMLSGPDILRRARPQLVEELGAVYQLLVDLEDEVSGTKDTVAKHGYKLQHLDLAMQMLSEIGSELIISNGSQLLISPRLENLRAVCHKALQTPGARH